MEIHQKSLRMSQAYARERSRLIDVTTAQRPLRAFRTGEDISLAWIRRVRKGGDAWLAGEAAMEGGEAYRVRVSGGIAVREWDVDGPAALYTAAELATDFPSGGAAILEVAQLGSDGEPGGWSKVELTIPAP